MKPNRNIPIEISVLDVDAEKQRIQVSFYGDVNEVTFVKYQRIQFFDAVDDTKIYTGRYVTFNGLHYIDNIESNVLDFFQEITTSSVFTTYDYTFFWLPNQENYLTMKMVYDFFKNKCSPMKVGLTNTNSVYSQETEESMYGFFTPMDKYKLDNTKVYIKSDSNPDSSTNKVFYIRVNNYKQFDIMLFGDEYMCQMNCCFSSTNDLSVVFIHNNFENNINISAIKCQGEEETLLKLTVTSNDPISNCIIGIEDIYDIYDSFDVTEYTTEVLTFNDGLDTIEITPRTFKVDKQRVLCFEDSSIGAMLIEPGTDLKDLLKTGEYYCIDNTDLLNIPEGLTVGFTLLSYSDGPEERPTRYQLIDNDGKCYIGIYSNGTIVWKELLNELPEHTHDPEDINTNEENQFVSQEDIDRWNSGSSSGKHAWFVKHDIVPAEQNMYYENQFVMKKKFLYVYNDLTLIIRTLPPGIEGLIVIKNLSDDESIDITIGFSNISVLMFGVDTNLIADSRTVSVPKAKGLEIYYMRLDANNLICKVRLLNVINIDVRCYRVVGEEDDVVVPTTSC